MQIVKNTTILFEPIIYKLALCPRFDSWWHHNKKELLI